MLDEWGRLVIHLVVGGFHQAAASTQLFFAALQRRHLLRLNLRSIQSFYLHPKKKTLRTLPSSPRPQGGAKSECPALPGRRPRLNQTNASFDAQEGRARASPPPATALCIAHLTSPRTSQPGTELASLAGDGDGKLKGPSASPGRPQQRPSPLRDRRAAPGSRAGASVAHRLTRLKPPRPGLARAGCRGFCSQGPSPSPGEADGASERPGRLGLGEP